MKPTDTFRTYQGRPIQIIWMDENGNIRFQYRPDLNEIWMQVKTLHKTDPDFGISRKMLNTLED